MLLTELRLNRKKSIARRALETPMEDKSKMETIRPAPIVSSAVSGQNQGTVRATPGLIDAELRWAPAEGPNRSAPAGRRRRERLRLVPAMPEYMEGGHAPLVAANDLAAIRQDRTLRWFTASATNG